MCWIPFRFTRYRQVEYSCRSLEKLNSRVDISVGIATARNLAVAAPEEKSVVNGGVNEWNTDLSVYLTKVNAPGSRISFYREKSRVGQTCVTFLNPCLPNEMRNLRASFRETVDAQFPGRYVWLQEASWHCTLRSLDREEECTSIR